MKNLCVMLLAFIITVGGLANILSKKTHYYLPAAQLPEELIYLLISLQDSSYLGPVEEKIPRLDYLLQKIPSHDLLSIVKLETNKFLLEKGKERTKEIVPSKAPSLNITLIEEFLSEHQSTLKIFSVWFIQAYLHDLRKIIASEYYPKYLEQIQFPDKDLTAPVRSLRKKINLLTPWSSLILNPSFEDFTITMDEMGHALFQHLMACLEQFAQQTLFDYQSTSRTNTGTPLTFFSLTPIKKNFSKVKSLDEIITPIIAAPTSVTPANLADQPPRPAPWMPKDIPVSEPQTPLLPTPDPGYHAPKVLPTPINDWDLAEEITLSTDQPQTAPKTPPAAAAGEQELFPTPNPAYIPPRELPRPVDNW